MSGMRYLSLCSGIEAASVAWLPLGWQAVAYSEIDPFACAVLAHHYPDVPNIGDMTQVLDWRSYAGTVNIVVAGTPCQDFSVAGKRAGLAGERSGLALVFVQVLSIVRPKWFVWENVPGVFSTNGGRDFGTFLRALDDIGYSCAWRVLDAQYFGVPQRRRRVFLVGHLGDWRPAAAVLFEPHCLRGDTAPCRKTRADITQALTGRLGGGGPDDNKAQGGFYVPIEVQHTKLVISQYGDKAAALTCEGADASPCADRGATVIAYDTTQITSPHNGSNPKFGAPCHAISARAHPPTIIGFHGSQDPDVSGDIAHPVARNQGRECCIAFAERGRAAGRTLEYQEEQAYCLTNLASGGCAYSRRIMTPQMQVRRLTPRECERLQGFPDDYTAIRYRGKPAADAPRYRALGNSMAVPVMRWIGARIAWVEAQIKSPAGEAGHRRCAGKLKQMIG